MRTIITGGAGFIGSTLAWHLVSRGDEVVVIDDLSTGSRENLPSQAKFARPLDILADGLLISDLVRTSDRIFHLASVVGVEEVIRKPFRTRAVIVEGTRRLLEVARSSKIPFLFASSSEVYGDMAGTLKEGHASKETSSASIYGLAKFEAEELVRRSGLRSVIVRPFNVVGPRQTDKYGMVLPRFVRQALRGEDLTVYSPGTQSRTLTDVRDIVRAMVELIECEAAAGRTVNLGGTESISMHRLAEAVKASTHSSSRIVLVSTANSPRRGYVDPAARTPDLTTARQLIGFVPRYNLQASIDAVLHEEELCCI